MHPYPGNWVATGRAVVYFARAAHAFSLRNYMSALYNFKYYIFIFRSFGFSFTGIISYLHFCITVLPNVMYEIIL